MTSSRSQNKITDPETFVFDSTSNITSTTQYFHVSTHLKQTEFKFPYKSITGTRHKEKQQVEKFQRRSK